MQFTAGRVKVISYRPAETRVAAETPLLRTNVPLPRMSAVNVAKPKDCACAPVTASRVAVANAAIAKFLSPRSRRVVSFIDPSPPRKRRQLASEAHGYGGEKCAGD